MIRTTIAAMIAGNLSPSPRSATRRGRMLRLLLPNLALLGACGGSDVAGPSSPAQVAVATVIVSPPTATLPPNTTAQLTASVRDASGNTLAGRTVAWNSSNSAVATVDASGSVTSISAGTATVSATSEGRSGSATITVQPSVASVTIAGAANTKVGDSYTYTATARLGDGAVVTRAATWSLRDPSQGSMSPNGVLVPVQIGNIDIQVTIDGVVWTAHTTAYDWRDLSSGGTLIIALDAESPITNRFGISSTPSLVFSCAPSGYFFVWVSAASFVTKNGLVAYGLDGGQITSQTWDELSPSYNSLWYPGGNTKSRTFASVVASARTFAFAFTEFNGTAKAMMFRVTGLSAKLAPLIAACPSNSLDIMSLPESQQDIVRASTGAGFGAALSDDSALRARIGSQPSALPSLFPRMP
jgi:hypothetical protein